MKLEEQLFARHAGKSILLDSNLLLVYLSGALGASFFRRFKRVSEYGMEDYELLVRLLKSFTILLTTPHVLTEVSNLANSLPSTYKQDWNLNLETLIASARHPVGMRESWTPAAELVESPDFSAFGITDAALSRLSAEALIVTDDYRLSGALRSRGVLALNFRDVRYLRLSAHD
jgi:hypothetical protein